MKERDLPPCDPEIIDKGVVVFIGESSIRSVNFEPWVVKIREASGQRVDWYEGGHKIVRAIGDRDKIRRAILDHFPEYVKMLIRALQKYDTILGESRVDHSVCDSLTFTSRALLTGDWGIK